MKSIYNMSKEEILGLSAEQIETLIDYECALQGIPLLPDQPVPPTCSEIIPDSTVYAIDNFVFTSLVDASQVMQAIGAAALYRISYPGGGNYTDKVLQPVNPSNYYYPKIETHAVFSQEYWEKVKVSKQINEQANQTYESALEEYNSKLSRRQAVVDDITELVELTHQEARQQDALITEFYRYLKLAEGNPSIALNFLISAHVNIEDDFPDLIQSLRETPCELCLDFSESDADGVCTA